MRFDASKESLADVSKFQLEPFRIKQSSISILHQFFWTQWEKHQFSPVETYKQLMEN